jgi:hypothetical protein
VRRIVINEPGDDAWQKWRALCDTEQLKLNQAASAGQPVAIVPDIYKGKKFDIRNRFFFCLRLPFCGKCAYCEQTIYGDQHGDVEHFRPKDAVTDRSNRKVYVSVNGKEALHPGYYWLAYNWRNLLPSCSLCNTLSRRSEGSRLIGKGTRFPVEGKHAENPGDEVKEKPLLILPTEEDPGDHLEMTSTGVLRGKGRKGLTTIEILGLNERGLPDARRQMYLNTQMKLGLVLQALGRGERHRDQDLENELKKSLEGYGEFSMAATKALRDRLPIIETYLSQLEA